MTFDVAILAGGRGTRLRSRADGLPKSMVRIAGKPLLAHQIDLCARHGFSRILLLVHYEHEMIRDHFGDGGRHGVTIDYQVEATPRGTGGALADALDRLDSTFLVLYGDIYLDVDLRRFRDAHIRQGADATMFVQPSDHLLEADLVEVDERRFITALHPYPHPQDRYFRNLASAALYAAERSAFEAAPRSEHPLDLARDMFPAFLRSGRRLFAYLSPEYIRDIGAPERLDRVAREIASGVPERLSGRRPRSAVFLDRDGTLNREVHRLKRIDELELLDGAAEAIERLNHSGRLAVVITNQAAVARGELSLVALDAIHARLEHLLGARGAYLDRIYVCPHHPERGIDGEAAHLNMQCDCRKPGTGMIEAACRDLAIDRGTSWLVGDATSDIEAGRRAGLRTVLVRTGHGGQDGRWPVTPDYAVADLRAAVDLIAGGTVD